jgi:hypothetical protein
MNTHTTWNKLKGMAKGFTAWSNKSFGSPRGEIGKLEKRLAWLRSSGATRSYSHEEKEIEHKLCELFKKEEIMACQRSWVEWLQAGDHNTSFFHARGAARKISNRIKYLIRDDSSKCETQEEIKSLAHTFYKDLFSSEPCIDANKILESIPPPCIDANKILESIPARIDQPINDELCRPYSDEEIKEDLF